MWGTTRAIPSLCLVVEVAAPGLIVIKHHSSETAGKFVNVAVLEGDQVKIVDERAAAIPDCPALLTALLGSESPPAWVHSASIGERAGAACGFDAGARPRRIAAGGSRLGLQGEPELGANPSSRPSPTRCRRRFRLWPSWLAPRATTAAS